ncbi:MAG TPA: hypothetical protein VNJ08_16910 [Bacteriovoracaceae bacterium]|nr:hypothetical protein [Bacteriovoracaceae bacterium]
MKKQIPVNERIKMVLEPKRSSIKARLFVTREDGITIYDSIQDNTTTSVAALVSGLWQASEALMGLVHEGREVMEFRLGFDTSSQGIYLFPFSLTNKRYYLGAIYHDCVNPGQLKRQIAMIKEEMDRLFLSEPAPAPLPPVRGRDGFLFQDISDAEIDRLFSLGGI